ncbi:LacI family DNA-binding transcriptional regulator [uncultured Victivallis sp.]|uniref:LacI family DNA-binding transcriptional regulator n=1 Tax=uncultured Victivallis sp. TaxID=354118 RepID=UPI0025CE3FD7|nr:LacI family DNA-binding transcriptional regulator [uncultured Victivallis sp.]
MSKSEHLKLQLLEQIRVSAPGTRLPTERELSEKYGFSRSTVNKVIVELERESYVRRRIGSGTYVMPRDTEIRYADGETGRTGRFQGEIIIVYPNFFGSILWEMVDQAEELASKHNIRLTPVKLRPKSDYSILFSMAERSTELLGVIVIPPGEGVPCSVYHQLLQYARRVVAADQFTDCRMPGLYGVCGDQFRQGFLLMNELLENGHREIGYVANEPFTPSRKEFLNGVKQALYDRRLRWKNIRKSPMVNASWQSSLDAGYYGTLPLLQEHPEVTAIFYDTCPGAQAGLAALNELGRRCPDEISVIATSCFCGSENYTIPALTTVSYPARVLMDRAFEIILMPEKKFPERSLTPPELHRRASVRNLML